MWRVRGLSRISLSYNVLPLFSADASIYVSFSPSYLFRTVRFRSIQLDTSIPSARGDCSSDKRNRKINIRNFQAAEKTENTSHEAQNILNISRQCITRSAGYTPEYTGKFTIFASDRRIPHSLRRRCRLPSALPSYPPQKHIKKGPALNRAGPAIQ